MGPPKFCPCNTSAVTEALDSESYDDGEPAPEMSLEDEQLAPVEQPIE